VGCGIDVNTGFTCGTGLDTFDGFWINVDGVGIGQTGTGLCPLGVAPFGGTNCYGFGGYPANPWADNWLILKGERTCGGTVVPFCFQSKPTSIPGCVPGLSVDTGDVFAVGGSHWITQHVPLGPGVTATVGIHIYTAGPGIGQSTFSANIPFGTLCLSGFLRAGPPVVLGGTPNTCVGTFSYDLTANFAALQANDPNLAIGNDINVQGWYRDPPAPATANFTNAIFYTLGVPGGGGSAGQAPAPPPPPVITSSGPGSGQEGTLVTITGTNLGTVVDGFKVLLANGFGLAEPTALKFDITGGVIEIKAIVGPVFTTASGPVSVLRGTPSTLPDNAVALLGVSSTASGIEQITNASIGNGSSFTLTAVSPSTVGDQSGLPVVGTLSFDTTGAAGGTQVSVSAAFATASDKRSFDFVMNFTAPPTPDQLAAHLAQHVNDRFGPTLSASATGSNVRITMAGATYGAVIVSKQ
jgi:hypothetical protein